MSPGMRLPLGRIVGWVKLWSRPRSTKLSRMSGWTFKIVVANGGELFSQLWQVFYGLFDPIVGHVIGCRFGAQAQVITDVPLEKAVCVVRANAMPTKIIRSLHESIDDLIYRRSRLGSDPLHFH